MKTSKTVAAWFGGVAVTAIVSLAMTSAPADAKVTDHDSSGDRIIQTRDTGWDIP